MSLRLQNPLLSSTSLPVAVKMLNPEDECAEHIKPVPGLILSLQSRCSSFLQVFMVNQFTVSLRRGREELGLVRDNPVSPLAELFSALGTVGQLLVRALARGEMPDAERGEILAIPWEVSPGETFERLNSPRCP